MREIKFRAWDKTYERFVSVDDAYYLEKHGGFDTRALADENGWKPVLMQYTGLKDKNGVEIYEGDILERKRVTWTDDKPNGSYTKRKVVQWVNNPNRLGFNIAHSERNEVIGNIYENKELLDD